MIVVASSPLLPLYAKKVWKARAHFTMRAGIWSRSWNLMLVSCSPTSTVNASNSNRLVSCLALSDCSDIHKEFPAKAIGLLKKKLAFSLNLTPVD